MRSLYGHGQRRNRLKAWSNQESLNVTHFVLCGGAVLKMTIYHAAVVTVRRDQPRRERRPHHFSMCPGQSDLGDAAALN